jgi:hypothetical protein
MRLIPIHCESCVRTSLVSDSALANGTVACAECGGRARALPGESYAEADAALFNELVAMLREAGITPVNAAQLVVELEARSHDDPGRGLRRLAQVLPSLGILELIVAHNPTSMRKAEGMLALLLDALANGRRQSGFLPAAVTPGLKRVKTGEGEG